MSATMTMNKNIEEPKVQIISITDFNERNNIGGLITPSKYYDCLYYCDKKSLYDTFKDELHNKKILKVLTLTENYDKIQNKKIKYTCRLFCEDNLPDSIYLEDYNSYVTNHPYGNVIILTQ